MAAFTEGKTVEMGNISPIWQTHDEWLASEAKIFLPLLAYNLALRTCRDEDFVMSVLAWPKKRCRMNESTEEIMDLIDHTDRRENGGWNPVSLKSLTNDSDELRAIYADRTIKAANADIYDAQQESAAREFERQILTCFLGWWRHDEREV